MVPRGSLYDLLERVAVYARIEDPRIGEVDDDTFLEMLKAIGRVKHLGPLAAIAGPERDTCVLRMAVELLRFRTSQSSAPSSETSTPAP
jgi:hypothetical protein